MKEEMSYHERMAMLSIYKKSNLPVEQTGTPTRLLPEFDKFWRQRNLRKKPRNKKKTCPTCGK